MTQSLHEQDREVVVSAREFGKMRYLIDAIALFDAMYQDFKQMRETVALQDGVQLDVRMDWRSVVNHCQPQVLVVIAHDPVGEEVVEFPLYAVLPESGQFILLSKVMSLSVEESDDGKPEVDVEGALNSLTTHASALNGGKKENAMKQLSILRRIMR